MMVSEVYLVLSTMSYSLISVRFVRGREGGVMMCCMAILGTIITKMNNLEIVHLRLHDIDPTYLVTDIKKDEQPSRYFL